MDRYQCKMRYAQDKDFIYNFAMTLTPDLETWFKVTDWAKGREDMLRTISDGRKDGHTYTGH